MNIRFHCLFFVLHLSSFCRGLNAGVPQPSVYLDGMKFIPFKMLKKNLPAVIIVMVALILIALVILLSEV